MSSWLVMIVLAMPRVLILLRSFRTDDTDYPTAALRPLRLSGHAFSSSLFAQNLGNTAGLEAVVGVLP